MTYLNPRWLIKIEGKVLGYDLSADVISVAFEDHARDADMATIVVNNANNKWCDSSLFEIGNAIEIQLGYGNNLESVFSGLIARPELSFPESGASILTVRAYDLSYKMRKKQDDAVTRTHNNITDPDLVKEIAAGHGFKISQMTLGRADAVIEYIPQSSDITDWEFLRNRAERLGFELYVEGEELHFHESPVSASGNVFEYGRNLKNFDVHISVAEKITKVVVKGWDADKKVPIIAVATSETTAERLILGTEAASDFIERHFGEGSVVLHDRVPASQKEAEDVAKAYFRQKEYELIEGHGSCVGEPGLHAKSLVEIVGVGSKFSGTYYFSRVQHTLDASGYLCDFDCTRNAITLASLQSKKPVGKLVKLGYGVE